MTARVQPQTNPSAGEYPLVWFSLSFAAGIFVSSRVPLPLRTWISLAAFVIVLFIFSRVLAVSSSPQSSSVFRLLFLVYFLSFFIGAAYYQVRQPVIDAHHVAFYNDRDYEVFITGTVVDMPDYRDAYTNLRVDSSAIDTGDGDYPVTGLILVRVQPNREYHYGQVLRLRGQLKTPPENEEFSYRDFLARDGIHSMLTNAEATILPEEGGHSFFKAVFALKEKSLANIYKIFPDPEASLLAGILLGVDTGLPKDLQDAFKNTGTAHIIAISGFNIAIISGLFFNLLKKPLGNRLGAIVAVMSIAFYTLLVGANAAVLRAAIMGALGLFARQVGRRSSGLNALSIAAFFMLVHNPLTLWDIGFQFSCSATLGLILYAETFSNYAQSFITRFMAPSAAQKVIRPLSDFVLLTFAAQLTTFPIMAYHFKRFPLISFIANPFILPAQESLMIVGGLAVLISLFILPLGQLMAWVAWPFTAYTIRVVEFFNVRQGSIYLGDFSIGFVILFYGFLFCRFRLQEWLSTLKVRLRAAALGLTFTALFVCTLLTWRVAFNAGDGQLHVTFLDVGSANAILIRTPSGKNVLINGGSSASELSDDLGRRLPFFNRKLDWLIVASTLENDVSALPRIVERYSPQNVLWSGNEQASYSARLLDEYFAANEIPVAYAETGQKLDLGDGAFIEVLSKGPRGSVLLIEWKNFRAVLPIGVGEGTWESLEFGNAVDKADVLLLADSGFVLANPPDVFENLRPRLAILSVAAGDPAGLPSQETLDALEGFSLLRTDRNGWIDVSTDGSQMRVDAERQGAADEESTPISR